ncbi:zinc-ribbon domain-containing protein [Clostridium algoriphilum]|uniref:zinc-ribbon domain-containing protein n=1 Tax=Clostridium algoriphilum TaxID=198347 RepID=UPI001CF292E5|nr:zinc ribbon domain-containing protein [Clostridium algoriphilum]MCB2294373.1 zinc-ribbon domain-containing protein [Clostridium algoriphilum]
MSFCQKCGAKLQEGDTFCGNCGARLEGAIANLLIIKEKRKNKIGLSQIDKPILSLSSLILQMNSRHLPQGVIIHTPV